MNQMIVSLLNTLGLKSDPQTVVAFRNTVKEVATSALQPPVPFSFSAVVSFDTGVVTYGLGFVLPYSLELPAAAIPADLSGFVIYLDTQRGSYWGDIAISVSASSIYDTEVQLTPIDNTQCNSLVFAEFNDSVAAGAEYTISITATGGGHSITRTFTLNIEAEA